MKGVHASLLAFKITVAYVIIGGAWVLLGDSILEFLMGKREFTSEQVFVYNTVKGLLYILITGVVLYVFTLRAFRESSNLEKQYRTLFEDNPNPMWVYNKQNNKIVAVNNAAVAAYGYTKEEFLMLSKGDIRSGGDEELQHSEWIKNISRDNDGSILRHKRKNGELFYVKVYLNPTIFNKQEAILVMARDITEKKNIEERNVLLNKNLSEYKERLDTILNTVDDVVWSCDINFKLNFISNAATQVYGYSPAEFYSNTVLWKNLVHPDDKGLITRYSEKLFEEGKNEGKYRIIHKSGETRYIYDKAAVRYNENREQDGFFGIATDITELQLSEDKFKSYSERIAHILDNITDGFMTLDQEWRITYVNKVFEKINRTTKENYLGRIIWEAYPPIKDSLFYKKVHEAVTGGPVSFEEQYQQSGRWFQYNIYPNPEGMAVFFSDTTETHKMQEEIVRTQNNLNALINNTPDFIWSIDKEFRVQAINAPYKMFLKSFMGIDIKEGDLMLFDHFGPEMREKWLSYYTMGLSGKYFVVEDEFEMPNMGKIYFETSFNPIRNSIDEVTGLGCFSRDITLQKLSELRISEQNRQLLEIAWMQSHEIRGPLTIIMGLSSLFNRENPEDPENKKILEMLEEAAKKLDDVVSKIVIQSHEARKDIHD